MTLLLAPRRTIQDEQFLALFGLNNADDADNANWKLILRARTERIKWMQCMMKSLSFSWCRTINCRVCDCDRKRISWFLWLYCWICSKRKTSRWRTRHKSRAQNDYMYHVDSTTKVLFTRVIFISYTLCGIMDVVFNFVAATTTTSLSPISLDNYPWKNYFLNTNLNNNNDLISNKACSVYALRWSVWCVECRLHTSVRDVEVLCNAFNFMRSVCIWRLSLLRIALQWSRRFVQAHTLLRVSRLLLVYCMGSFDVWSVIWIINNK